MQEKYIEVASELIVYTYFFSASEDVLPEVSCSAPTVSIEMVELSSVGSGTTEIAYYSILVFDKFQTNYTNIQIFFLSLYEKKKYKLGLSTWFVLYKWLVQ